MPRSTDATWITGSSFSTPRSSTTTRPDFPVAVCTWAVRLFAAMQRVISTLGPMRARKSTLARSENRWLAGFGTPERGGRPASRSRLRSSGRSTTSAPGASVASASSQLTPKPSKPPDFGVGDVAGERGDRAPDVGCVSRRGLPDRFVFLCPDVEWDGTNLPDGQIGRGHEAILDHVMRWADAWDDWTVEVERVVEGGTDQVVLFTRERGRSDSGLAMDERHAELYTLKDGKIVRRQGFSDPRQAVKAAGLRE